jgi:hypothetical protein
VLTCRKDTENLHHRGKEAESLQRKLDMTLIGMTFDLGAELARLEDVI